MALDEDEIVKKKKLDGVEEDDGGEKSRDGFQKHTKRLTFKKS